LIIANPNNLSNSCGGLLTATPGATSISLIIGSLAANASCTISLDLQVTAPGVLTSPAVTLSSNQAPNATAAAINLTVTVPAPAFTMAYFPSSTTVSSGSRATGVLRFTISNNANISLMNVAFQHILPTAPDNGLEVNGTVTHTSCGSPAITTSGSPLNTIQFTGGQVAAGGTCVVNIPVQTVSNFTGSPGPRTYVSTPVILNSSAASVTAGPAFWTVQVN
jgi:hypothetical protein